MGCSGYEYELRNDGRKDTRRAIPRATTQVVVVRSSQAEDAGSGQFLRRLTSIAVGFCSAVELSLADFAPQRWNVKPGWRAWTRVASPSSPPAGPHRVRPPVR